MAIPGSQKQVHDSILSLPQRVDALACAGVIADDEYEDPNCHKRVHEPTQHSRHNVEQDTDPRPEYFRGKIASAANTASPAPDDGGGEKRQATRPPTSVRLSSSRAPRQFAGP
jgi:hypothetical protein